MFIGEKQKMNNEQKYPLDKATIYIITFAFAAIMFLLVLYAKNISLHPVIDKAMELQKNNQIDDVSFYAVYDLFNKQFSLLLTVMGAFVTIFGVAVPLAIAFLQQKSGEMKQKQLNELQEKLEIQEKKNNEFFEKQKDEMQQALCDLKNDAYTNIHMSSAYIYLRSFDIKLLNDGMLRCCISSCCEASKYAKDKKDADLVAKIAADFLKQSAKDLDIAFLDLLITDFKDTTSCVTESNLSADAKQYITNKINDAIEIMRKR